MLSDGIHDLDSSLSITGELK